MSALERELTALFGQRLGLNAPLAPFTSFRIGGPADLLITVENEAELMAAMALAHRHAVAAFCLGAGTNLLVSDRGIRGLVVRLGDGFNFIKINELQVRAGAGVAFGALVEKVVARGLTGLEFGEGIPGTVGGGLVMNAGAFGGEMAKVVTCVHGVTIEGQVRALGKAEVGFAYRRTNLPPGFTITQVDFELGEGDRDAMQGKVTELRAKRSTRQPLGVPNAGSIFKNPPGNFAGRLPRGRGSQRNPPGRRGVLRPACEFYRQPGRRSRCRGARADRIGARQSQGEQRGRSRTRGQIGRRMVAQ